MNRLFRRCFETLLLCVAQFVPISPERWPAAASFWKRVLDSNDVIMSDRSERYR
jgi:hypothetical protein